MTRLLTTGWETGDITEAGGTSSVGTSGSQAVVTTTPTPRSPGSYCLKCGYAASAGNSSRDFTLAATKTDLWVRVSVFLHAGAQMFTILSFLDSAAAVQGTVTWDPADQFVRVYRGGNLTLLGTSVLLLTPDQWHTFEVRWQITSTSVGIVEVWVDDTRWLNLTAIDNTQSANTNIQGVRLGYISGAAGAGAYCAYDDLAINDTAGTTNTGQIFDGRIVFLRPTGAGSTTAQTRGGTDSGANWSQVDELPPSLTDYVFSATAATRDTYALQDIPAGSWSVNCCEVLAFGQNSDTGTGSLGLTVKSGVTTNEGTAQNLTTSGAYYRQLYETDPATSVAWTTTAVNALEAGTTVR